MQEYILQTSLSTDQDSFDPTSEFNVHSNDIFKDFENLLDELESPPKHGDHEEAKGGDM
jgi:hypothetical protein